MWLLQYAAPDYVDAEPWDPLRYGDMGFIESGLDAYLAECGMRWLSGVEAQVICDRFFDEIPD